MRSEEIEKKIYSTFANISSIIGYSEIHGRIIGALLVEGKPMSLQRLAQKTGYSASTISLSLDLLELLGMIKKAREAGDRKLYIALQGDLLSGLKKAFVAQVQKSIDDTLQQFSDYRKDLKASKDRDKEKVMKTLSVLDKEVRRVGRYVSLLSKVRI